MFRPRTTAALLLALLCTSYSKEALPRADLTDALRTVLQPDGGGVHDEYSFAADEAAMRCAGRPEERSPAFRCALLLHSLRLASTVRTLCPFLALNLTRPSQRVRVCEPDANLTRPWGGSSWIAARATKKLDIFFQGARESGFRGQFVDHYAEWLRNGTWPSSVRTRADCGRECFAQSVFCFTPPGFDGISWTGRDSGAVLAGCIPVHYNKSWPFDRFIWWSHISINAGAEDEQALASTPALVTDALRNASWVRNAQLGLRQLWPAMTIVPSWERRTRPDLVDTLTLLVAELAHRT